MVKNQKNFLTNRMNSQIFSQKIRIVNRGEFDEEIAEIVSRQDALYLREKYGTDLIEITVNEKENSSICKLMDKDKFLYQERKKEKERKSNQKNAELKEVKLGVDIASHDLETKLKQARKFLERGDNVKVSLQLKGRHAYMNASKDKSMEIVLKFADSLTDVCKITNVPTWVNNRLSTVLNTKIKK